MRHRRDFVTGRKFLTRSRDSVIIKNMVGHIFKVHNGLKYFDLLIHPNMLGSKLGNFIFTKNMGKILHTNNRLNRKKAINNLLKKKKKKKKQKKKKKKKKK